MDIWNIHNDYQKPGENIEKWWQEIFKFNNYIDIAEKQQLWGSSLVTNLKRV
jgi:hypothetical protein